MPLPIFFIDLNYYRKSTSSIIPFPLSVAYMAAYIEKMIPNHFHAHLFKDPLRFLERVDLEKPVLAAFSNYVWNANLQMEAARHIKKHHPHCVTVMGGPNFNFSEPTWMEDFARKHPHIDFFIEGEGEAKFLNIVQCGLAHNFDANAMKHSNPAGGAFFNPSNGHFIFNNLAQSPGVWNALDASSVDVKRSCLRNVNDVPSPYLSGLMDVFLADPDFCPIIETNRGCPYTCTFCNWGSMGKSKSRMFDLNRITNEFDYIAQNNVGLQNRFYIGDANFGLFPRDLEIAQYLVDLRNRYGFPDKLFMYFAKNSSERVLAIGKTLEGMIRSNLSISRQSMNDQVLANIRRSNIKMETFTSLSQLAGELGVETKVELIYTLPGESKDSFFSGIRQLSRERVDTIHLYPALLLNGSEMGGTANREKFGLKGEFRLIDGSIGTFGPLSAMEFEEIITQTDAMNRHDHMEIRLFHFFIYLFLDLKLFKNVEVLMEDCGILELVEKLTTRYHLAETPLRNLVDAFIVQSNHELHSAPPDKVTEEEVRETISRGVKLNPLYAAKLLFDPGVRPAFYRWVQETLQDMVTPPKEMLAAVFETMDAHIYPFDGQQNHKVLLRLDPSLFQNRQLRNRNAIKEYLLPHAREFVFHKKNTYESFLIREKGELTLAEKVYRIMTVHSNESYGHTLSCTPE